MQKKNNHDNQKVFPFSIIALLLGVTHVFAGPPFLTDDPVPVDYKHSELYIFSTYDQTRSGKNVALPAFEYNYGIFPDTQFHIGVPFIKNNPTEGLSDYGTGDVELGMKYRFIQETNHTPQIGIFPMVELPTGDVNKGLGNGKTWWKLPVWGQKSWNEWTMYGGVGYVINTAEGRKNYSFVGWQLQKELSEKWILGGEVFARQKDTFNGKNTTIVNVGGYYKFSPDFNLLFSAGHSVNGENHTVGYLGLWWAFGGDAQIKRFPQPAWSLSQTAH